MIEAQAAAVAAVWIEADLTWSCHHSSSQYMSIRSSPSLRQAQSPLSSDEWTRLSARSFNSAATQWDQKEMLGPMRDGWQVPFQLSSDHECTWSTAYTSPLPQNCQFAVVFIRTMIPFMTAWPNHGKKPYIRLWRIEDYTRLVLVCIPSSSPPSTYLWTEAAVTRFDLNSEIDGVMLGGIWAQWAAALKWARWKIAA